MGTGKRGIVNATDTDIEDVFTLDVRVIEDVRFGDAPVACDTSNGCENTCASACASAA